MPISQSAIRDPSYDRQADKWLGMGIKVLDDESEPALCKKIMEEEKHATLTATALYDDDAEGGRTTKEQIELREAV
jgi:hypothetical protein